MWVGGWGTGGGGWYVEEGWVGSGWAWDRAQQDVQTAQQGRVTKWVCPVGEVRRLQSSEKLRRHRAQHPQGAISGQGKGGGVEEKGGGGAGNPCIIG